MKQAERTGRRKRGLAGWMLFSCMIALVAGSAAWHFFVRNGGEGISWATAAVQRGSIEDLVAATGVLQPRNYVDVGAQVSGQLQRIGVEVGDFVKEGELLAEIDPTLFVAKVDASRAQLRYQKAQLQDRKAQLQQAVNQHERQKNLMAEGATTLEAAQNAETSLLSAEAQVAMLLAQIEQTESTLRADEASLGYARIYAPMDGTVVSISARQGQTLNASQQAPTILRIADLSTMTVETRVSEADIGRLFMGMDVYFTTLGSQNRRWRGKLKRIEPTPVVENNVVLYNALFDVENSGGELFTQMTAQVFFVVAAAANTLVIPQSALMAGEPGQERMAPGGGRGRRPETPGERPEKGARAEVKMARVRVLGSNGVAEIREVRTGVSNRVQVQVLSGLEEGEKVITGQLLAGQRSPARTEGGMPGMPRMR
ncbi:efflux RND transporter periplasmic adaptor subunit [Desulfobotulus sp. H1]|uniref:Efflux RND transporter periplasmic adaptor subunit n=1 Tax=Desulfobotulus pelophilus TaxID=2823377 RepID=A0ABT3N9A2_9BACT|nr:efflux RND transporter periplasmic adaptor subunit [Desulfobotulus pelophilus]MCW7754042.1 efflux RND transporter periplasmic adaptor subunit [Desulfobotulus pelophilus]